MLCAKPLRKATDAKTTMKMATLHTRGSVGKYLALISWFPCGLAESQPKSYLFPPSDARRIEQ